MQLTLLLSSLAALSFVSAKPAQCKRGTYVDANNCTWTTHCASVKANTSPIGGSLQPHLYGCINSCSEASEAGCTVVDFNLRTHACALFTGYEGMARVPKISSAVLEGCNLE